MLREECALFFFRLLFCSLHYMLPRTPAMPVHAPTPHPHPHVYICTNKYMNTHSCVNKEKSSMKWRGNLEQQQVCLCSQCSKEHSPASFPAKLRFGLFTLCLLYAVKNMRPLLHACPLLQSDYTALRLLRRGARTTNTRAYTPPFRGDGRLHQTTK
jgi:hypothetical protein